MKIKERIRPVLKIIRIIVGCIIALLAGLLAGTCFFCAIAALFGGLELDSFGEQSGYFLLYFVLAAIFFYAMVWGRRIKNGSTGKQQVKSVVQAAPTPNLPQPTEDQRQLEEIERNIDYTAGAIQANPMSRGTAANEAHIMQLQAEKKARLARIAAHLEKITVQDAWKTFTPEQQKRFDAQVYQYSQDVGRGGLEHEIAAANRGLVFVDARPVPKEVAARLKELQEAATAGKERKKNMTLQPMDYPVPFTELLIYPNRIVKRPKTAQVLHQEESASYGVRTKETVYLYEENGRTSLVCEKQRWDEHGPQEDSEWSMKARLSLVPQPCHRIPLAKWALSLSWKDLRQYTDEICVRMSGEPTEDKFKRYRRIKASRMKNSHDQPGWNCTYDEIGLGFDSLDVWYLRRESHWREAPTGLPYNVTIVMKLLPGVEKESEETLCGLMDSLPWWDPNSADRTLWDARNWLDADWLHRQAELNDSMHRKHPHNDGYEKALDEVLKQLCLLEEPKPSVKEEPEKKKTLTFKPALSSDLKGYRMDMHTDSGKSQKVNRWVNLIGEPGQHGDVIRIGFGDGKCYLEITNDGFPNPGASGGMMVTIPGDIVRGNRLDARKFLEFYRSVYPGGTPIDDFTNRIWFYQPTPGRPEGTVELIKQLGAEERRDGAAFSFEKTVIKRELVQAGDQLYLRITNYDCSSGANGRPLYSLIEDYHVLYLNDAQTALQLLTPENGLRYAAKSPVYRYVEHDTGVLF